MEALKECYNKVMNCLESRKRFVNHINNSIYHTIYLVDRCKDELMSQASSQHSGVSYEAIYNLNMAQSDVDEVYAALE